MKEAPVFSIRLNSTVLPRAQFFSSLEDEVKAAFAKKSIFIEPSSPIFRSYGKNVWRVVSEDRSNITAYRLKLSYDRATKMERIDVYPDSISGLPLSVWEFKAFTSSIRSPESNRRLYYTGTVRESLNRKQKQKWDYFFRPEVPKISKAYDRIIDDCKQDLEAARSSLSNSKMSFGIFGLLLLALFFPVGDSDMGEIIKGLLWPIFGLYGIVLLIRLMRNKVSMNFSRLAREVEKLETYLRNVETEKTSTLAQLDDIKVPDDKTMKKWLAVEMGHMQEESEAKYIFSDTISKIDALKGLGIYQPEFSEIARKFPKKISTFFGFRVANDKLLYSGLYMVFVFQTEEKICITKFFYDFILAKKYGENNLEYHFSDLVGIAINSKLINNPFQDENVENQEINTIWMSFTDSNNVEIAIIDKDTSESIAERLTGEGTAPEADPDHWLDNEDSLDNEAEDSEDEGENLSMGKALDIIRNIKDQKLKLSKWNSTKPGDQQKEKVSEKRKAR